MNSFFTRSWSSAISIVILVLLASKCSFVEAAENKRASQDAQLFGMGGHNPLAAIAGLVIKTQHKSVMPDQRPQSTGHTADADKKSWFSEGSTTRAGSLSSLPSDLGDNVQCDVVKPKRTQSLPMSSKLPPQKSDSIAITPPSKPKLSKNYSPEAEVEARRLTSMRFKADLIKENVIVHNEPSHTPPSYQGPLTSGTANSPTRRIVPRGSVFLMDCEKNDVLLKGEVQFPEDTEE